MIEKITMKMIDEVMPNVWNIVFEINGHPFQYSTDLLYLPAKKTWVVSRRIPHELKSLLSFQRCPLCHHDGISCKTASNHVETIIQFVLADQEFQQMTLIDHFTSYQFVNGKKEWSQLYMLNQEGVQ